MGTGDCGNRTEMTQTTQVSEQGPIFFGEHRSLLRTTNSANARENGEMVKRIEPETPRKEPVPLSNNRDGWLTELPAAKISDVPLTSLLTGQFSWGKMVLSSQTG